MCVKRGLVVHYMVPKYTSLEVQNDLAIILKNLILIQLIEWA